MFKIVSRVNAQRASTLVLAVFLAPVLVGLIIAMLSLTARPARAVYCGTVTASGGNGTISWQNSIDGDFTVACTGNNQKSYWYPAGASVAIDEIYKSERAWYCGSLFYNSARTWYNVQYNNGFSNYSPNNSCGGQADVNAHFVELGSLDTWNYLNW
jgi:hypothetical protein